VDDQIVPSSLLWKDCPSDRIGNVDYLLEVIDWELNVDPEFAKHRFMAPIPVRPEAEMREDGFLEYWICYRSEAVSAKELTVLPGRSVCIRDAAAYGLIMVQGFGSINQHKLETPALIRYGQLTSDEYFVSETAAKNGVQITNASDTDPIVMLKHFGPANPELLPAK
jgi:hypothetical protein